MKELRRLKPSTAERPPDLRLSRRVLITAAAVAGLGPTIMAIPAEAQDTPVECLADLGVF
jgi:hypothetical protein